MAQLYYDLITQGLWTLDKVPTFWKAEVEQMLNPADIAE